MHRDISFYDMKNENAANLQKLVKCLHARGCERWKIKYFVDFIQKISFNFSIPTNQFQRE